MLFADTYLVTDKLELFTHEEVDAAEAALGTRFPEGYREYVTTLGKGEYCGYVNVFPPMQIAADQLGGKPFLEEFCELWDGTEFGITSERLAKAIMLGNSIDGDSVIFERGLPEAVYILPESEDLIYKAGTTLLDGLAWLMKHRCSSPFRYFNSKINQQYKLRPTTMRLSLDKFRDWITALGEYDHLEEFWDSNPGVTMDMYAALKLEMGMVVPELGEVTAYYKSFSGYVSASAMSSEGVTARLIHDAEKSNDTLKQIADYLRSKAV